MALSSHASSAAPLQAWDSPGTGLLVNERLMNAPPSLGPPLMQFLLQEVAERAAEGARSACFFIPTAYFWFALLRFPLSRHSQPCMAASLPHGPSVLHLRGAHEQRHACMACSSAPLSFLCVSCAFIMPPFPRRGRRCQALPVQALPVSH